MKTFTSPSSSGIGNSRVETVGKTVTRTLGFGQDERVQADSPGGHWLHEQKGLQTTELETQGNATHTNIYTYLLSELIKNVSVALS